jgi:hypothetical protein
MRRPQFTLRALLVAMLAVACFFGGMAAGERRERQRLDSQWSAIRAEQKYHVEWQSHLLSTRDDVMKRERTLREQSRTLASPTSRAPQ